MMLKSRTQKQTIQEMQVSERSRRRKYFWLWLKNSRPILGAFILLMGVVSFIVTGVLLDGGNGLVFLGWFACIGVLLAAILQFIWVERGYTVRDWAPRAMRGTKYGW